MDNSKGNLVYCNTCNARTEVKIIKTYTKSRVIVPSDDPVDSQYHVTVYEFALCSVCEEPFLFENDYIEVPGDFSVPRGRWMLYPYRDIFPGKGVPKSVGRAQQDAVRSYAAGLYEPCVIMCRKCIEAMCYELGKTKGNLHQRLYILLSQQKIDNKLIKWSDGLRMIGNDAAHDFDAQINETDALDSLHFLEAIIMYVFSLNERFDEFQSRRSKLK